MVSSPPMKMGEGFIFQDQWGSAFSCGLWAGGEGGGYFIWGESQLGISLGGPQYQFLAQLANAEPKSSEFNKLSQRSLQNQILPNCHF